MIDRKKKLRFIQLTLLIFGILLIYTTYYTQDFSERDNSINNLNQKKVEEKSNENGEVKKDVFKKVEYSGLDLQGNRYIIKSEEAYRDEINLEVIEMKLVKATFYFKDGTTLYIEAENGTYNNQSLNMKFENKVKANYLNSELFAEKAEYSNTQNFLSIYENVRINDSRGNLIADKLLFDIKKQKLDITSFNDGKINANVNLNEKRF